MSSPQDLPPRRATLFDSAATKYDRYRPGYPPSLIEKLASLAEISPSSRLLEAGCGTGKATVMVAKAGCSIDCVDPGQNLISLARKNCASWPRVTFIVGKFEGVDLTPNHYDLVFSAQAFHWVDPTVRWKRCKECLVAGGSIALIHNYSVPSGEGAGKELSDLVSRESGGAMKQSNNESSIENWHNEIRSTGFFGPVDVARIKWTRRCSAEEYVGLFGTFSDYLSLPETQQRRIADGIVEIAARNSAIIELTYESVLMHARKIQEPY